MAALAASADAASISYGNLGPVPPGVSFLNIVESSGTDAVPLYGAPTAFATGLSFFPTAAFSALGAAGGADLTDGQLNYTVAAPGGVNQVDFSETGVYTLVGAGTAATQTLAGASLRAIVTEINGVPIAPVNLVPSLGSMIFNLASHGGVNQPWQIALSVNVAAQMAGLGYSPSDRATRVDVVIDNQLASVSEPGTQAMISKTVFVGTTQGVPEPTGVALAGLALAGLAAVRSRRSA
ncbi:MAG: hypothetical protein DCC67_19380 [Planctomycetota bacterium]|nr:MAG: hypothetical protein DCC67_19380 [Planctomycetota bacterium]